LAVNRIVGDPARLSDFAKENQQRLRKMAEEAELTLRVAITRMYRAMYYPDASASEKHAPVPLPAPAQDQGDVERDQTEIVLRALKDLDKVLTADDPDIPPKYIREKAWPGNAGARHGAADPQGVRDADQPEDPPRRQQAQGDDQARVRSGSGSTWTPARAARTRTNPRPRRWSRSPTTPS